MTPTPNSITPNPATPYLVVDQFGAFVGRHSERLQVRKGNELLQEAPLFNLEGVIIASHGVALSADAITACADAGIPIHFVHASGRISASIFSAGLTGTIQTRRAQLEAAHTRHGFTLAKAFALGKISNQAALIRYLAKYRKGIKPDLHRELKQRADEVMACAAQLRALSGHTAEEIRLQLLSIEGHAAEKYWEAIRLVVHVPSDWKGRSGRGATDPVNAALNYGYGILYSQVERAIVLAGLDPYAGFIHADRPGKPSLVLDLVEEFRVPVVDRTIFAMINRGTKLEIDSENLLVQKTRRAIAENILARLDKPECYERKKLALRHIIQYQARHIATFLRGDRAGYKPFIVRW
ncbi:MAG: CRISPR-associated endonuclease Cas1 [Chloroflexi bacterium]|nr:CRISPR-associated endonuclease Cas1 [Chloroflexota bacterium]